MGCTSSVAKPSGASAPPEPVQKSESESFWVAGTVKAGDPTLEVPVTGPYGNGCCEPQPYTQEIYFSSSEIPRELGNQMSTNKLEATGSIFCRAFFPHPLPCFSVGWAKIDVTPEHPHHNCKKQREKDKEKIKLGFPIDYSKRKRFFIYPERISEIGLFLTVNGKELSTDHAVSQSNWQADKIPGSFFSFAPDHGSMFKENSISIPLKPSIDDSLCKDRRWNILAQEISKVLASLKPGTHTFVFSLKFRYGSSKFAAFRSQDETVYRYTDDDRKETELSTTICKSELKVVIDDSSHKQNISYVEKLKAVTLNGPVPPGQAFA